MPSPYFAPVFFLFISFVFSMLGMGGSQLYIPVMFWLGMDFKTEAIPLGMLLNVVSSFSAASTYVRSRLVAWRIALTFGLAMVAMAPLGTWANIGLPTRPVIAIFAMFTATAAILMLSGWKPKRGLLPPRQRVVLGLTAGGLLGFFAGLIGRGGGSFVVPLLYIAGLDPKAAAATSAVVVTFSGTSSFVSHILTAARPDPLLWALSIVAVVAGSQAGSRFMALKMKPKSVKLVFGLVLLTVAAVLLIKDVWLSGSDAVATQTQGTPRLTRSANHVERTPHVRRRGPVFAASRSKPLVGEAYEWKREMLEMIKIQVLGTGCPKCQKLAANAEAAAKELGLDYELEKVTDINEIMRFGVMMTPALAVNGQIKVAGRVPEVGEIKKML